METLKYFADLIGTRLIEMPSRGVSYDAYGYLTGFSYQLSTQHEYYIQPYEFAHMNQVVVHAREGTMVLAKHKPDKPLFFNSLRPELPGPELPAPVNAAFRNETEMLTLEERKISAESVLAAYEAEQSLKREKQQRKDRVTTLVAEMATEALGDISSEERMLLFLDELARDPEMKQILLERKARQEMNSGEFAPLS